MDDGRTSPLRSAFSPFPSESIHRSCKSSWDLLSLHWTEVTGRMLSDFCAFPDLSAHGPEMLHDRVSAHAEPVVQCQIFTVQFVIYLSRVTIRPDDHSGKIYDAPCYGHASLSCRRFLNGVIASVRPSRCDCAKHCAAHRRRLGRSSDRYFPSAHIRINLHE